MKRAQMEILGLAIVVVLILLALVFAIRFLPERNSPTPTIKDSQLAASYISTLLKTTTDCAPRMDGEALLQDCAIDGGVICNDGSSTCDKIEELTTDVFNQTLDVWKTPYYFAMYSSRADFEVIPPNPKVAIGTRCTGPRQSKSQPLTTDIGQTMYVVMDICR